MLPVAAVAYHVAAAVVAISLAATAGIVYCLPRVIPLKATLTVGNQRC
jgi:hypothetical protein